MNLTSTQKKALDFQRNLSISAGAGSGKTSLLIHRILYLLKKIETFSLSKLVAITFTNKAADELRLRLSNLLLSEIESCSDPVLRKKLKFEINFIHSASISTFDSFWKGILNEYASELNLDPDFTVMSSFERSTILDETIKKCYRQSIEEKDSDFSRLLTHIPSKSLTTVLSTALSFLPIKAENEKALRKKWRKIHLDYEERLKQRLATDSDLHYLLNLISKMSVKSPPKEFLSLREASDSFLQNFSIDSLQSIRGSLVTTKNVLRKSYEKEEKFSPTEIETFADLTPIVLTYSKEILPPLAEQDEDYLRLYPLFTAYLEKVDQLFSQEKRLLKKFEFSDFTRFVDELFQKRPKIIEEIRKKYQFVMIDEFQDTNFKQWNLLSKFLLKDSYLDAFKLFIVGDAKQSIYAFRGGEVAVFKKLQELIRKSNRFHRNNNKNFYHNDEKIESRSDERDGIIFLENNYRSNPKSLDFINHIFSQIFTFQKSLYDVDAMSLKSKKEKLETDEKVRYFLNCSSELEEREEARFIAERILEEHRLKRRPFRDFAILLRSRTKQDLIENELRKRSIPFLSFLNQSFFNRQEILDFYYMLRFTCFPNDNLALLAVLRSPFFNYSNEAIAELAFQRKKSLFEESKRDKELYLELQKILNDAKKLSLHRFFHKLLLQSNYLENIEQIKQKETLSNLRKLIKSMDHFLENSKHDRYDFEVFLRKQIEADSKEDEIDFASDAEDSVNIMTIHKAKGLQFKVVFLPFLHTEMYSKLNQSFYDEKLGFYSSVFKAKKINENEESFIHAYFKQVQRKKEFAEEKRVLYVAMTRVEEALYLSSSHKEEESSPIIPEMTYAALINMAMNSNLSHKKSDERLEIISSYESFPKLDSSPEPPSENFFYQKKSIKSSGNKFSPSRIQSFLESKESYFIKYYLGLFSADYDRNKSVLLETARAEKRETNLDGMRFGTIVHEILEELSGKKNYLEVIERVLKQQQISNTKDRQSIRRSIESFLKSEKTAFIRNSTQVHKEKIIQFKEGENYLIGILDLLVFHQGSWLIVDYKTNQLALNELEALAEKKYRFQMELYAALLAQVYPKQEHYEVKLYFTELDQFYEKSYSKSDLAAIQKQWPAIIDDMLNFENELLSTQKAKSLK